MRRTIVALTIAALGAAYSCGKDNNFQPRNTAEVVFKALGLNDKNHNGVIEKQSFWERLIEENEGYKVMLDRPYPIKQGISAISYERDGKITEKEAWSAFLRKYFSIPEPARQEVINQLVKQTEGIVDEKGFAIDAGEAYDRLKQIGYPGLEDLILSRVEAINPAEHESLVKQRAWAAAIEAIPENLEHQTRDRIKERLLELPDNYQSEGVIKKLHIFGDDERVTKKLMRYLELDELDECEMPREGAIRSDLKDMALFSLLKIAEKGFHRDTILSIVRNVFLSEQPIAYRTRLSIALYMIPGDDILKRLGGEEFKFFRTRNGLEGFGYLTQYDHLRKFVSGNLSPPIGPTGCRRCCGTHIIEGLGALVLNRAPPSGAIPDIEVTHHFGTGGGIKGNYVRAYIEKNMNNFSYRGYKIWQFEDEEIFKKVFKGVPISLWVYPEKGRPYIVHDSPRDRKRYAIRKLVEESDVNALFDQICPKGGFWSTVTFRALNSSELEERLTKLYKSGNFYFDSFITRELAKRRPDAIVNSLLEEYRKNGHLMEEQIYFLGGYGDSKVKKVLKEIIEKVEGTQSYRYTVIDEEIAALKALPRIEDRHYAARIRAVQ